MCACVITAADRGCKSPGALMPSRSPRRHAKELTLQRGTAALTLTDPFVSKTLHATGGLGSRRVKSDKALPTD